MFHLHCMSWDAAIRLSFAKLGWRAHFPAEKQHVGRHCLTLILLNASRKHRFQAGVSIVNTDLEPMGMEKMENQNSNFSLIMYCGNLPRCILFQNAWPLCMPQDLGKGSYHDGQKQQTKAVPKLSSKWKILSLQLPQVFWHMQKTWERSHVTLSYPAGSAKQKISTLF